MLPTATLGKKSKKTGRYHQKTRKGFNSKESQTI